MRSVADLEFIVANTIRQSGGTAPFTISAVSEEEAAVIRGLLKGRHKAGAINVTVYPVAWFKPIMPRWEDIPGEVVVNPTNKVGGAY